MPTVGLVIPQQTYRATAFLTAAEMIGVDVVTISDTPQALAGVMGDRFLLIALSDPMNAAAKIVAHSNTIHLDGVVAIDDGGALVASYAAQQLGLIHNSPAAVEATRNKAQMRTMLSSTSVHQPELVIVDGSNGDRTCLIGEAADALGYPVVIKPSSLSGSRGVIRANDATSARAAAKQVLEISRDAGDAPDAPILVERFIDGIEIAFEGRLRDGHLEQLAIFDKPDPLNGPYFEETIYVTPTRLPIRTQQAIHRTVAHACDGLGLTQGPIHAELRITNDGVVVFLELAARTIGGRCSRALQFAGGVTVESLVLADALGMPTPKVEPSGEASGVMMLPIKTSGRLIEIRNQEQAFATEYITGLEMTIPLGRIVQPPPQADRYLGFLFASAPTPELVTTALRQAAGELDIEIAAEPDAIA